MLPKKRRLTTALFDQVFKNGRMQHSERFWIRSFLLPNTTRPVAGKFAVAVSKKVSPTAVDRNSIKRMIYGLISKTSLSCDVGFGVIVGVKKSLRDVSPADIENELFLLLKKVSK